MGKFTVTTQSIKTSWLQACQYAIQDGSTFSVIATKQLHQKWDGRMGALNK